MSSFDVTFDRTDNNFSSSFARGAGTTRIHDDDVSPTATWSSEKISEELEQKVDVPVNAGEPGQILGLDEDGNTIWTDNQGEVDYATDEEVEEILT